MAARVFAVCLFCMAAVAAWAAPVSAGGETATARGEGAYTPAGNESREDVQALAAFEAALDAVRKAAGELERRDEVARGQGMSHLVLPLAAGLCQVRVLKQSCPANGTCSMEVEAVLTVEDFVKADDQAVKMRKAASREGFRAEMEPTLPAEFNPAESLARANAELSLGRLRPAVLYLDRLLAKYSNWAGALVVRGRAYRAMNEDARARADLARACELGMESACALAK